MGIINISMSPRLDLLYLHKTKYHFRNSDIDLYFTIITNKLYFINKEIHGSLPISVISYEGNRRTTNSSDPIISSSKLENYYSNAVGSDSYEIYSVKPGDNIYEISRDYYDDVPNNIHVKISEINGIYPPNNNLIFPGQNLIMPKNLDALEEMYRVR